MGDTCAGQGNVIMSSKHMDIKAGCNKSAAQQVPAKYMKVLLE